MALVLSKHFLRTISQATKEGPTSLSLWSLADVEKAQEKARELLRAEAEELERQHGGADGQAGRRHGNRHGCFLNGLF